MTNYGPNLKRGRLILGVDGCPAGWCVALARLVGSQLEATEVRVVSAFKDIVDALGSDGIAAVDIPIGLLDQAERGGRTVDRTARSMLGRKRGTSVFSAPIRGVLECVSHAHAAELSRKSSNARMALSVQSFGIIPKIRECDAALTAAQQSRVVEIHPELCFYAMNQGPVEASKKTPEGQRIRISLLDGEGFGFVHDALKIGIARSVATPDDIIDAHAALWTARRYALGIARRIPGNPPSDSRGLRMEMWM
jgi:predicted RNase H-like nuclease